MREFSSYIDYEEKGQVGYDEVSEYVINSENAFSREHTQWIARKQN